MPELPEVETVARELNKKVSQKTIQKIQSDHPKMIKGLSLESLKRQIYKKKILKVLRRGKNLLLELENQRTIWVHLKMTGHFIYLPSKNTLKKEKAIQQDRFNTYIHFIFYLTDGSQMLLSDLRKFARIRLLKGKAEEIIKNPPRFGMDKLGTEPLSREFTPQELRKILQKKKKAIKPALMDQESIAGIGNIYASEILFIAGVNPLKKSNALSAKEVKKIHIAIKKVLLKAIKLKGTSTSDFRNTNGKKGGFGSELKVYGKTGKKCPKCGKLIFRIKQAQRSTFYCATCQKAS